jgi:hypothetical protein
MHNLLHRTQPSGLGDEFRTYVMASQTWVLLVQVSSPEEIMGLLEEGNKRRKTDSTDANATSSRSHAVGAVLSGD